MSERIREFTGFLCRWSILGLAIVTCLSAASTALRVLPGNWYHVFVPDVLCVAGDEPLYVSCYAAELPRRSGVKLFMATRPDGTICSTLRRDRVSLVVLPDRPLGRHELPIQGLPFGPLAFQGQTAKLLVAPRGRRFFYIDAHLASQGLRKDEGLWHQCIRCMQAAGEVAFFHSSDPWTYLPQQKRIRKHWPEIPLVYVRFNPEESERYGRWMLSMAGASRRDGYRGATILTSMNWLADALARDGQPVAFVAVGDEDDWPTEAMVIHRGLEGLLESLEPVEGAER